MKLARAVLLLVGAFLATSLMFAYLEFALYSPSGFGELHQETPTKPLLLSGLSLLGIVSKRMFDVATQQGRTGIGDKLANVLSPTSLIRAIIICPIVIVSFYQSLQQIDDLFLVGLIAYQNGFFFETVLQTQGRKQEKEEKQNEPR